MAPPPGRKFKLKMAELIHLLEGEILAKLNSYNGLYEAKDELWRTVRARVKAQYPEARWTYTYQMREWENHPIQQYINWIELNLPLPDLPPELEKLSLDEIQEYLIWKGENHQGIKEWKKYGRNAKRENHPKDNLKKQTSPPKGARAYVPGGAKRGPDLVQLEALKK